MKLAFLSSRLGKLSVKAVSIAGAVMALVLLFVVAWGGSYPSYDPNPPILIPRQGDVWHVGEMHTVQWSVNDIPTTNSSGKPVLALLLLAYWSDSSEPALLRHEPLTDWIPITDKMANVIVPSVPTRSDYAIFLNAHDDRSSCSGTITIFNPDDPSGTGAPPRTLLVTTAPPIASTVSFPPPTPLAVSFVADANITATSSLSSVTQTSSSTEPSSSVPSPTLRPRRAGSSASSAAQSLSFGLCRHTLSILAILLPLILALPSCVPYI
ncbi:hypothetical protein GY45DRAFT_765603 [Cubamyces sp. BRFM 1775]|nr:hypothetical protein GY45DRAFT_765603 [Cubamyces sp. BRFM 1775]